MICGNCDRPMEQIDTTFHICPYCGNEHDTSYVDPDSVTVEEIDDEIPDFLDLEPIRASVTHSRFPCSHEGCEEDANEYVLPGLGEDGGDVVYSLCAAHAPEAGICFFCGYLIAGTEDEHNFYKNGVCSDCLSELGFEEHVR